MLDRWRAQQQSDARSKLPLSNPQLEAMFDMLDLELPIHGCDHTLRLTKAWLTSSALPIEPVITWLHDNGGYCDCEALANTEERWKGAIADDP